MGRCRPRRRDPADPRPNPGPGTDHARRGDAERSRLQIITGWSFTNVHRPHEFDDKTLPLSHVRNIGIAAHVDAGKTTLTERILFYTGASHKIGEVHDGAAHMDYMAEEQRHGITITSAVTKAPWHDHLLQIVDTPGHVDFTIEVERSMRVLDGAILVIDGVRGVEPQTETVWRQRCPFQPPGPLLRQQDGPPGGGLPPSLDSLRQRLGAEPVPVTIPLPEGARRPSVVHLIERRLIGFTGDQGTDLIDEPCPADIWEQFADEREALLWPAPSRTRIWPTRPLRRGPGAGGVADRPAPGHPGRAPLPLLWRQRPAQSGRPAPARWRHQVAPRPPRPPALPGPGRMAARRRSPWTPRGPWSPWPSRCRCGRVAATSSPASTAASSSPATRSSS